MGDQLNVLLVVFEGVRADHCSALGYPRPTTPFLETVAAEGVRFPHMISNAPSSSSAHASLFTGRFASAHGVHAESPVLGDSLPVLPEILAKAGYRTGAFCTNRIIGPESGFGRGFDSFATQRYQNRIADRAVSYGRRAGDRILRRSDAGGRRTNEALRDWVEQVEAPFFAFVHYDETRLPLRTSVAIDPAFLDRETASLRLRSTAQDVDAHAAGDERLSDAERRLLIAYYDNALRYVDARVEEIAAALRERGRWDDTLLVVTSDHGQAFGEHGLLGSRVGLYDDLLRVPLVMRCPGRIPEGFVVEEIAQTVDVAPTVLHLLGLDLPSEMQGRALFSKGRASAGPGYAIAERFRPNLLDARRRFPDAPWDRWDQRMKAIRTRKEKLVWCADERNELYDLEEDPREERNRIEGEVARGDALRRRLFDWFAGVHPAPAARAVSA